MAIKSNMEYGPGRYLTYGFVLGQLFNEPLNLAISWNSNIYEVAKFVDQL